MTSDEKINRRARRRRRRLKGAAGGTVLTLGALSVATTPQPASAESYWTEVQHNIQGFLNNHNGNTGYSDYVVSKINAWKPIAASVNEVCKSQADDIWNSLSSRYHIWFVYAHPDINGCGSGTTPFGNVLLISKDADITRNNEWNGYAWYGPGLYSGDTNIFGSQWSSRNPKEYKRADCATVTGGTNSPRKFAFCSLHLVGDSTGDPHVQMNDLIFNGTMPAPRAFQGDFNLGGGFMVNNVSNWRFDTLHTTESTSSQGKIDWVLGRSDDEFYRGTHASEQNSGLPRGEGTSELACPRGWPGRMFRCPSPIRRSSATMS